MIGVMLCHVVGRFGTEEQRQAFLPELTSMVYESYMQLMLLIIICSCPKFNLTGMDVMIEALKGLFSNVTRQSVIYCCRSCCPLTA